MTRAKPSSLSLPEALGLLRLATDGAEGITDMVENVHGSVLGTPGLAPLARGPVRATTRLVYKGVRGAFRLTGKAVDVAASLVERKPDHRPISSRRESVLAALNGVLGDHLMETGNPLALEMRFRREGRALALEPSALADALPDVTGRLVVLVHGLCMSDLQWMRGGHDHGAALARDHGYTPIYLSYNSGLHISANGAAFAGVLEELVAAWPVEIEKFVIIGHSMGGLVTRSACLTSEAAGHAWRRKLDKIVFLGTPHHGAPLERIGNWIETILGKLPYASAFASLGKARSAGITDLRYGNLMNENREGCDRFAREPDARRPAPLPEDVACYAIAATMAESPGAAKDLLLGDGLVPVTSALGRHENPARALAFPDNRQWIARQTGHLDLLSRRDVYERMAAWLGDDE